MMFCKKNSCEMMKEICRKGIKSKILNRKLHANIYDINYFQYCISRAISAAARAKSSEAHVTRSRN